MHTLREINNITTMKTLHFFSSNENLEFLVMKTEFSWNSISTI